MLYLAQSKFICLVGSSSYDLGEIMLVISTHKAFNVANANCMHVDPSTIHNKFFSNGSWKNLFSFLYHVHFPFFLLNNMLAPCPHTPTQCMRGMDYNHKGRSQMIAHA